MSQIKKVVVIGSGVMGSAIAAQIANSKTNVLLLDIVSKTSNDRSSIARQAKDKLLEMRPAPLSHFSNVNYITVGNIEDDLEDINNADLIIEAIIEKLSIKHDLYQKISKYMINNNALLASNTSTLPRSQLVKGLPAKLHNRFYITHFFNPPRYMELLELVSSTNGDKQTIENSKKLSQFIEKSLGKIVINCKDTPGFIANRIGCFFLEMAVRKAIEMKLQPAIIDKVAAKYFAFPSTGIFALYDLIGHDVMELISKSLKSSLAKDDRYHDIYKQNAILQQLKESGSLGKKSGVGFYKIHKLSDTSKGAKKVTSQLNFDDMTYADVSKTMPLNLPTKLEDFFNENNEYAEYFQYIMQEYFSYCNSLTPSITQNISDIDDAMKLGYGMKMGPFELLQIMPDNIKAQFNSKLERKKSAHQETTNTANNVISDRVIYQSNSSLLIDKKEGYLFSLQSKMGTLNSNIFNELIKAIDLAEQKKKDLFISSNAPVFSAGADLSYFFEKINNKEFQDISNLIKLGQQAMIRLKYSSVNVTTIAAGLALGGGAEILLHSRNNILHQNINAGLVEVSVGLIPGWGGTKEMIIRGALDHNVLLENISNIIFYRKASSAEYFNEQYNIDCEINMNKKLIFQEATALNKSPCLKQSNDKLQIHKINLQEMKNNDCHFDKLQLDLIDFFQEIINQQTYNEQDLLQIEHDQFIKLCHMPYALERITRILKPRI